MTEATADGSWLILRRAGVMVVLDVAGPHLPRIVHWGRDIAGLTAADCAVLPDARYRPRPRDGRAAEVTSTPAQGLPGWPGLTGSGEPRDADIPFTVLPSRAEGWPGWPGLSGHRDGVASQPLFALTDVSRSGTEAGDVVRYRGDDGTAALRLDAELRLTADGVLMHRQTLTSTAAADEAPYTVGSLVTLLPVSEHAVEVLDHAGRWANEAQPQRQVLHQGTWLREQRRGRTGPDSPLLLTVGTPGFDFGEGEVWGLHLGWSGDQRYLAQRLNTGVTLIGAGEIVEAGEVVLAAGESMTTPWVFGTWSDRGLDGASSRLHRLLRHRPNHPRHPRPVVLNTWEAVYFDLSFERLVALADVAAEVGVERFVVDDGWFGSRRDDTSGLGDWSVAADVFPDGLRPVADHVRGRGMEFGLWFEPEMVNLDSDLARAHPEWVLGTAGRMPPPMRSQQVLDLGHPDAFAHLLEAMSRLVGDLGIAYIKWDHNRDLADPVHRSGPRAGRPAVRDQTLAAYLLMHELKARHPRLEIESCSSGGARLDYGVLQHTDRVWVSDCIDSVERVNIVLGASSLIPFELIGAHVGPARSSTTGRVQDLSLRLAVALFGHSGFEWDLTATSPWEREALAEWVRFVKRVRGLVHSGELVRAQRGTDPGTALYGVVSADRHEGLFNFVRLQSAARYNSAPLVFPGLDPELRYRVERVPIPGGGPPVHGPGTHGAVDVVAPGALLCFAGIEAPTLQPEQAAVYQLRAAD